jgi:hypothetical protein
MFGFVKVLGRVLILRRVATGDVAADEAHTQVNPGIAELYTLVTDVLLRLSYFYLIEVGAFFGH